MRTREYSHPALTEFAAIAGAFCDAVANVDHRTPEAQLDLLHRLLPRAYSAALQLPDASVSFEDHDSPAERDAGATHTETGPPQGLDQLASFLGVRRFYREVFDPYAESSDGEVTGDIIDDFGDIYWDLQRGLVQWHSGMAGEALWEWRFNFQIHWGEHATSALRAMFALSAWNDVPWPTGAG